MESFYRKRFFETNEPASATSGIYKSLFLTDELLYCITQLENLKRSLSVENKRYS